MSLSACSSLTARMTTRWQRVHNSAPYTAKKPTPSTVYLLIRCRYEIFNTHNKINSRWISGSLHLDLIINERSICPLLDCDAKFRIISRRIYIFHRFKYHLSIILEFETRSNIRITGSNDMSNNELIVAVSLNVKTCLKYKIICYLN